MQGGSIVLGGRTTSRSETVLLTEIDEDVILTEPRKEAATDYVSVSLKD
jgi:hypothetical protein